MNTYLALVVDDHPLVSESVGLLILSLAPSARVERRESLRACAALAARGARVDLAVLDLSLPDASGLQGLEQMRTWWPQARLIVFSGANNALLRRHCLEAGAEDFVIKTATTGDLRRAMQAALDASSRAGLTLHAAPVGVPAGAIGLPPKQMAVWHDLASGLSNNEIAERHGVSVNTVKSHVRELFERIGARNRTEAARLYAARSAAPPGP